MRIDVPTKSTILYFNDIEIRRWCTFLTSLHILKTLCPCDYANMRTCEYANKWYDVCSGFLIGRSAPPPSSTHGVREHDSAPGETTSWGRHNLTNKGPRGKSTLTPDIASRWNWRQLRPGGQLPITCRRAEETTTNQPLLSRVRRFYEGRRHSIANRGPQVKSGLTSKIGPRGTTPIKGRRLSITRHAAGGHDSQSADATYGQTII